MRTFTAGLIAISLLAGTAWADAPAAIDLDQVQVCKTVDENNRPIDVTKVFIPIDAFFVSVHARAATEGAPLTVRWYRDAELLKSDRVVIKNPGPASLYFEFDPPREGWVPGNYHADIVAGDAVTSTLPFSVSAEPGAQLVDVCMARDVSRTTLEPVEPTEVYPPVSRFFCCIKIDCPKLGEDIGIKWLRGDADVVKEVHVETHTLTTHYMAFALSPTGTKWAPGVYHAQLTIDGHDVRRLTFTVQ